MSGLSAEQLTDLGAATRKEHEDAKPKIVVAALTRMAARGAMAEGVRAGAGHKNQLLGDILSALFESGMVALDRPDTRSWTMLADRVLVTRLPVAPGPHTVEVSFGGGAPRTVAVDVPDGGCAAAVITEPR